jgi:energy-coupling factor transporter ATP-binding protein EcfA2
MGALDLLQCFLISSAETSRPAVLLFDYHCHCHYYLHLDQVSLQYPDTLARRLFSSVPRRDFAVHNVSLTLEQEIVLLQGASSSGKSALMKLMAGHEKPTSGSAKNSGRATPIWLADKPDHDNQNSVQSLFGKEARRFIKPTPLDARLDNNCVSIVTSTFSRLVHLDPDSKSFQQTPAQLSPSENYKIRLAIACLQSCLPGLQWNHINKEAVATLPAPILLLDEWLDSETRETSSKVERALLELVQSTGAVILCATHKPNLWKKLVVTESSEYTTQITMCRGAILTLLQRPKLAKPQH